ncbi:MAG: hypothetical protein ACFB20_03210 [Opitutales bacterium]
MNISASFRLPFGFLILGTSFSLITQTCLAALSLAPLATIEETEQVDRKRLANAQRDLELAQAQLLLLEKALEEAQRKFNTENASDEGKLSDERVNEQLEKLTLLQKNIR